ncbi:LysR family transcriptional regulator [Streptomyces platensis]|uniref:LysR family transcriptional regulator n=1 Tax=Streptomyces platensis TaxID=58346 RepID=UPI003868F76D
MTAFVPTNSSRSTPGLRQHPRSWGGAVTVSLRLAGCSAGAPDGRRRDCPPSPRYLHRSRAWFGGGGLVDRWDGDPHDPLLPQGGRHGVVFGGARALHVAEPSLSRQIRQLESFLGCELFVRHRGRLHISPAGARLRPVARDLVTRHDQAVALMRALAERSEPA